jgi:hypothetical protein
MSAIKSNQKAILVVDDDPLLRELLADILVDEGFVVIEANNAKRALQQLECFPDVKLLLTDIQMPGEFDGLELIRADCPINARAQTRPARIEDTSKGAPLLTRVLLEFLKSCLMRGHSPAGLGSR